MINFKCDYSEGAHPRILRGLVETNLMQMEGYGLDEISLSAEKVLKAKLESPNVDIHFVSGGTQANLICLAAFLKPYEAVIAVRTGHIATHETGAIEATGHKIIEVDGIDGKMTVEALQVVIEEHCDEHMVKPRLVFISNATELGTIYTKQELLELSNFSQKNGLLFYMDGARLGNALCSHKNDVKISDYVNIFDAFYIGGTKNGALLGEAIVICNSKLKPNFRFTIKQRGGLFAKGRIIGLQFYELFKDNLYFDLANHSNKLALYIREELINTGYKMYIDSPTNQQFFIVDNSALAMIETKFALTYWGKYSDTESVVRIVTSWATNELNCVDLVNLFKELKAI